MRIKNTEDFINFAKMTFRDHFSRMELIHLLFAVRIKWNRIGELNASIIHIEDYCGQRLHYFNNNGGLTELSSSWNNWDRQYYYRKAKDDKNGCCCLLPKGYTYFTTEEEAQQYIDTYTENHPEEYIKALKKAEKEHKADIRNWKHCLKEDTQELEQITIKLKAFEK